MSDVPIKPAMLVLLRQTHEQEQSLIDQLSEAERTAEGTPERWSIKDLIAHMAAWKQRHAEKLAAAARGETPPEWTDMELVNRLNAESYAADHDRSWQAVQNQADHACAALIAQVERMSEAELIDPNRYEWQAGSALWKETLANGVWHPYDHMTKLYLARGDAERALGINQALIDTLQVDAPAELRGDAIYNLACLYARHSRIDRTLAALREALSLNPKLIEWSRQDTDLDPLRAEPAFQALYKDVVPPAFLQPDHLVGAETLYTEQSTAAGPIVIDVRGASEYAAGHVAGALHIPLGQLSGQLEQFQRDRPIVTYCNMHHRGKSRGERAAALLREHGYQARALDGGFPAWQSAGMPVGEL
jgi:rhodanese-related sulfurtransferase